MSDQPSVRREIELPADLETIWGMIIDARIISDWMGATVEIDLKRGGEITMTPEDGPRIWGTVEEVLHQKRIQWSWRSDDGLPSLVEIELAPTSEPGSTILSVTETLLPWRISGPDGHTDWPQASALAADLLR